MRACLDSWAVLEWLDGAEPAATAVQDALDAGAPRISWINLVEVHHRIARDHGTEVADRTLEEVRELVEEELPGVARMRAVAALKAEHPIALADCFAIATAAAGNAALLTGDPEIVLREPDLPCGVLDARRQPRR